VFSSRHTLIPLIIIKANIKIPAIAEGNAETRCS